MAGRRERERKRVGRCRGQKPHGLPQAAPKPRWFDRLRVTAPLLLNLFSIVGSKAAVLAANIPGWSIVIVGAWNSRIFTPQWIGNGRLTRSETIQLEIPVDEPRAPRRFTFDDVALEVQSSRISLKVTREDDDLLRRIQKMAETLLVDLPHTPITGVGTNFSFIDSEPNATVTRVFGLADSGAVADEEWVAHTTNVRRELRKGDTVLNLILGLMNDGTVRYDLNYHSAPSRPVEALDHVRRDIVARKTEASALLRKLYYQ